LQTWPGAPLGSFSLIGACAVLAASMQGPVSAIVLVLELTRRFDTLMVPAMLATVGAVLVARLFENRSIYSGRIHAGRSAAGRAVGAKGEKGFFVLSSAAHFTEVLRAILDGTGRPQPLYVVDEQGKLLGEVSPERAQNPGPETWPLETATAADFGIKVQPILSSDDDTTIANKFAATDRDVLPVVQPKTSALIGIQHRCEGTIAPAATPDAH